MQLWAGMSHKRHSAHDLEVRSEATVISPLCSRDRCRAWNAVAAYVCCHFSAGSPCQHVAAPARLTLSDLLTPGSGVDLASWQKAPASSPLRYSHIQSGGSEAVSLMQILVHAPGFQPIATRFLLNLLSFLLILLLFPDARAADIPSHNGFFDPQSSKIKSLQ